jgi:hypothetical protein
MKFFYVNRVFVLMGFKKMKFEKSTKEIFRITRVSVLPKVPSYRGFTVLEFKNVTDILHYDMIYNIHITQSNCNK